MPREIAIRHTAMLRKALNEIYARFPDLRDWTDGQVEAYVSSKPRAPENRTVLGLIDPNDPRVKEKLAKLRKPEVL